jgi:hypothetical protein
MCETKPIGFVWILKRRAKRRPDAAGSDFTLQTGPDFLGGNDGAW